MSDPVLPELSGDPDSAELQELTPDEGERLIRKTTHEIEPGDMTAPLAP